MHGDHGDICFCLSCLDEARHAASFRSTLRELGTTLVPQW